MLIRRENAAFLSLANSSVIREEEGWREGEERKREDWRDNGSTRTKQTELVPREESDRSENLTGTIDFFFFFPPLECFQPPVASSQSAAI